MSFKMTSNMTIARFATYTKADPQTQHYWDVWNLSKISKILILVVSFEIAANHLKKVFAITISLIAIH